MSTVSTTYVVKGMTCDHCVHAVTEELSKLPGVTDVTIDLESGRVDVASDGPLHIDQVRIAVDDAGYDLVQ